MSMRSLLPRRSLGEGGFFPRMAFFVLQTELTEWTK